MQFIYTKRKHGSKGGRHRKNLSENLPRVEPGGFLRHLDNGSGLTVCPYHRDSPQWENVPRSEVRRDCPRCFHLRGLKTREERDA